MTDLIDKDGSIVNERTTACIEQVKAIVKQHLDCLIDSGARGSEIKEITKAFCKGVELACMNAIIELLDQLVEDEGDEDEV